MYENLTRLDLVGPALARALGDPGWERLEASLVSGGKSNLTFVLSSDAGEAVLRRPPDGPLLPRAHDMGREARVQRALAGTAVPVAAILLEDAGDLIGVPFYVMEKVDGYVIRGALPAGWAETAGERCAVADVLIDTLADLHAIDPTRSACPATAGPRAWGSGRCAGGATSGSGPRAARCRRSTNSPDAARRTAPWARGRDRARGLPDRQHPAGQADAADGAGRAGLGAVHPGGAAGRPRPVPVLLARAN
jgi:Predicted aminoglycoside phosphotransferase